MLIQHIEVAQGIQPQPLAHHNCVSIGNLMFTLCGKKVFVDEPESNVYVFDTITRKWNLVTTTGDVMPQNTFMSAAVAVGEDIYVFGGILANESSKCTSSLYCLNTKNLVWTKFGNEKNCPMERCGASIVYYKENLYIYGGRNGRELFSDVYRFDLKRKEWTKVTTKGKTPAPRTNHTSNVIGNKMYVFGGEIDSSHGFTVTTNEFYCLNLDTFEWKLLKPKGDIPQPRSCHCATVINDSELVIALGGDPKNFSQDYFGNVFIYDPIKNVFQMLKSRNNFELEKMIGSSVITRNSEIIFFGGMTRSEAVNVMYSATIKKTDPPKPRRRSIHDWIGELKRRTNSFAIGGNSIFGNLSPRASIRFRPRSISLVHMHLKNFKSQKDM